MRGGSPRVTSPEPLAGRESVGGASRVGAQGAASRGLAGLVHLVIRAPRAVVRAATGAGSGATPTPTLRRPRPQADAPARGAATARTADDRRTERLTLAPTPTRPIDATGHVDPRGITATSGGPGSTAAPTLRRAAPERDDRSVWRANEVLVLARSPHVFEHRQPKPAAVPWRTTGEPHGVPAFGRAHAPEVNESAAVAQPTPRLRRQDPMHRPPSGFTRRVWRQFEPRALQLPPEDAVDAASKLVATDPGPPAQATPQLAHHAPHLIASPTAAAYSFEPINESTVVIEHRQPIAQDAFAATPLAGDPELAKLVAPESLRQRSRIRTVIEGEVIAGAVAADRTLSERAAPAAALRQVVTVAAASLAVDLSHARAVSPRSDAVVRRQRTEKSIAGGVALLVLIASFIGVTPLDPVSGATGNTDREIAAPRIAIGVFSADASWPEPDVAYTDDELPLSEEYGFEMDPPTIFGPPQAASALATALTFGSEPTAGSRALPGATGGGSLFGTISEDGTLDPGTPALPLANRYEPDEQPTFATDDQGPFLADGTMVKPVVVETTVPDGKDKLREYKVKKGDTTADIAKRFKITAATIVWANNMTDVADLDIGTTLVIPPVAGILHVVKDGETLSGIARTTGIDSKRIIDANDLTETTVFIGQTLIIPGGKGEPIPAPGAAGVPTKDDPSRRNTVTIPRRTNIRTPVTYAGGAFAWPQTNGEVTQYFHYGHYALDIASDFGVPIKASAQGVVTFAGWKNNGGGWQVWISHGSDLYTTYNHMSAITVGIGQSVGRGEQIGRNGMSGWATGPHVHFEVWVGAIWEGGRRVNPLNYL